MGFTYTYDKLLHKHFKNQEQQSLPLKIYALWESRIYRTAFARGEAL